MPIEALCADCRQALLPWGRPPMVLSGSRRLAVASVGPHQGALAAAVKRLKFDGCLALGPVVGRRMAAVAPGGPWDLVVPIPVHRSRLRHRPVGQANRPARTIGRRRYAPILRRLDNTGARANMGAEERRELQPEFGLVRGARIDGRRCLLVDDVCTTGITLLRAAELLWEAGAESVWGVTLTSSLAATSEENPLN